MSEAKSERPKPEQPASGSAASAGGVVPKPRRLPFWLQTVRDCFVVNWQAKLISLVVAFVVWYLVRTYVDQERGIFMPPEFQPGVASALTSALASDTVRGSF